jgi:hypothetical protein
MTYAEPPTLVVRAPFGVALAIALALTSGCTRVEVRNDADEAVCDVVVTSGPVTFPIGRLEPGEVWGTTEYPDQTYGGTLCARRCSASERTCRAVNVVLLEFHTSQASITSSPASSSLDAQTLYLDGSGGLHDSAR